MSARIHPRPAAIQQHKTGPEITQLKPKPCKPCSEVNNTCPPKDGALLQCRSGGDPRKPRCVWLNLALQHRLRGTSQKYMWLVYTRRRDGYSKDSLRPLKDRVRRHIDTLSGEKTKRGEKAHDVHFHTLAWEAGLWNGGCGAGWGKAFVDLPKKCIGLSPNHPYLVILDKRLLGHVSGKRCNGSLSQYLLFTTVGGVLHL